MKRMIWSRFFRRWFLSRHAARTRTASKRLPRAAVRPNLESLEDRTLLSTYVVNQTGDSGAGSGLAGDIRYCINQANLNKGSTITFDTAKLFGNSGTGTITLNHGELPIKVDMTIQGSSSGPSVVTISGAGSAGSSRVFDISSSAATVTISDLTITGGNAEVANTKITGNQGGDIFNGGNLTLINDVVSNGTSSGQIGGPNGRGGAIYNAEGATAGSGAQLTLEGTIVENSTATGVNGGAGEGGGIYNDTNATLTLMPAGSTPTVIRNNQAIGSFAVSVAGAGLGGGIFNNTGATLNLKGSGNSGSIVIEDNLAQGAGGTSWGTSPNGGNGKHGGPGVKGLAGTAGGNANGGGVFNTGTVALQFTSFLGNQALAGDGGNGGKGGAGGTGTSVTGGSGGAGGSGGTGGAAQGGGLFSGSGTLTAANVVFGVDDNGQGNETVAGKGGSGGAGGAAGKGVTLGGKGGASGVGGAGGLAEGGAVASNGGNVSFTSGTFTGNQALGGAAGAAGTAGNGNAGTGNGAAGGAGGAGKAGGRGGDAIGGAVFNPGGNLLIANSTFTGNIATGGKGGAGGGGGVGGTGGAGSPLAAGGVGGSGGSGGVGGNGGNAQGGGFYNVVGTVTINNSSFLADKAGTGNEAISGGGGDGGVAGNGGQGGDNTSATGVKAGGNGGAGGLGGAGGTGGLAEGGGGANAGGDTTVTGSIFSSNLVQTGNGGAGNLGGTGGNGGNGTSTAFNGAGAAGGNGGTGGTGGTGFGGALAVTNSNLTVSTSTFGGPGAGNQVLGGTGGVGGVGGNLGTTGHPGPVSTTFNAGNGGQGGQGGAVSGGALSASANTHTIQITGSTFANNAITSGTGGQGGQGGQLSRDGATGGFSGQGGNAGLAQGGAIALSTTTNQNATLSSDSITSNTANGGTGGAGNTNINSVGSTGGIGGEVEGAGLADVNYNLTVNSATTITGDKGIGGIGGAGGGASATQPLTFSGGKGGAGGNALGGGVFVSTNLLGSVTASFNGDLVSNNNLTGGTGGAGGNAGASGHSDITGGAGGTGGVAQGGGLYMLAGSNSVNTSTLVNLTLAGNIITGGAGGNGGAGFNATGGNGGDAQGGAVFNTSLNVITPQSSSLAITGTTVTGNQANGGVGGFAGSGTTPNGGAGGVGGNGGNADGAGLYNGDNAPAIVVNSTFGGSSTNGNTSANYNVLSGGNGGSGGNAGTPTGVPSNNGGAGGMGGSIAGGNVYNVSTGTDFINDTLIYGQAVNVGAGGPGGSGAGKTGLAGAPGVSGKGVAGGFFAASGGTDTVGNTIIALDSAATAANADVAGTFASLNNNVLGSNAAASGFTKTNDQLNITAAQLNLGPLLNNGGPTLTDALLNNINGKSVAINAGSNTLVTSTANPWYKLFGPSPTDQRGPGFPRISAKTVDVGAYEVNIPVILKLNPPAAVEQSGQFTLTISGTGFLPGATVSFGGTTLTPTTVTNTQITVTVPGTLLPDEGSANVTVSVPDGSGIAGETLTSAPMAFTIAEGTSITLSNPGSLTDNEGDTISPVTITSSDPDTTFSATGLPPGLSIDPKTGAISGTIDPYAVTNGNPSQDFSVTINGTDDGTVQGSTTFTWTVNDTTQPTLTSPGNQTNNEGDTITGLTISAIDADPGTFTDVVNGQHTLPTGLTIDSTTGKITGTIAPFAVTNGNSSQAFAVTISASDNGIVGITTFTWSVNDTTPPAITNPGTQNNNEGDSVKFQITATDADSFSATGLPTGLSIDSTTGLITGTIGSYAAGSYSSTVTATDNGFSSSVKFTWNVADTTAPSFTNPGTQNNNEGDLISDVETTPVDADPGSITDVVNGQHTLPTGLTIDPTTGKISGTIDPRAAGTYTVTISATDGSITGSTTFTWNVADTTPPGFTNPGTQNNNESDKVSLATNPVDADSGSITDVVNGVHTLPPGLTINATTGEITGTINKYGTGAYNVTISATDGTGNVGTIIFTWNVADTTPPALTNPGTQNSNEGDNITFQMRATDAESFSATGLPTGLSIDPTTGLISGTIDPYGAGTYQVTVTANDDLLATKTSFTWNVADSSPPSFTNPGTQNNNEGDRVNLALNPVDADAGSITATGLPTGLRIDPTTGVISGTIDPYGAGKYTVTVNATDGPNAGSTTFTWNVADSTPPALTNPGPQNNFNETAIQLAVHTVDADSFSATGLPAGLSINPKTGVISGTLAAAAGTYHVTVNATDGNVTSSVTFPWVVNQLTTSVSIVNIHNTYIGLYQVETITAEVTDALGIPVNNGFVTFQVNDETFTAPVNNSVAIVTLATPMLSLDITILNNDFFSHTLDAVYSDPAGIFGISGAAVTEPAMLLDFLLFLETASFGSLAQQLVQLQS